MINKNQAQPNKSSDPQGFFLRQQEIHKELSATVRRTMFALLAYGASCVVIIAQPDLPFVLTSSGVKIPVINVAVNLKAFLIVGPFGLIAITAYLHLFLSKLARIDELGEFDKQPYLFNFNDRISRVLGFLIFYATPPIVMLAFSWKSMVIEWRRPIFFATMIVAAGMLLLYFKPKLKIRRIVIISIVTLLPMAAFSFVLGTHLYRGLNLKGVNLAEMKFREVGFKKADLRYAILRKSDFIGRDMSNAILVEADLSEANLRHAILSGANLGFANLSGADLSGTIVRKADLREANLKQANLNNATFRESDLRLVNMQKADLRRSRLREANLSEADLRGAYMIEADLRKAILHGTNLAGVNLKGARLNGVELNKANLSAAIMDYTDLTDAKLGGANLSGAQLRGCKFLGADLSKTNLRRADLSEAYLKDALNLTAEQLCEANRLSESILDPELENQIKKRCPEIFHGLRGKSNNQ